ncbi:hypothetical protein LguiA_036616 [Lonicera macranthoides]
MLTVDFSFIFFLFLGSILCIDGRHLVRSHFVPFSFTSVSTTLPPSQLCST